MLRASLIALAGCSACALVACAEPDPLTQLVVSVDTDVAIPSELFAIGFRIERGSPEDGGSAVGDFENFVDGAHRGARGLPVSLNVVAEKPGPLDVIVFGRLRDTIDGAHRLERRVRLVPVREQARLLCVKLERACIDATCAPDATCVGGVCVPPQIDAAALPVIEDVSEASCP